MRIPVGNFGSDVASAGPRASVPRGANGEAVAGAVEGLGNTMQNIGTGLMADQAAEAQKAVHAREAADRAQALVELGKGQDALADLHDEISTGVQTGQIDKTKAESTYSERASALLADQLKDVPDAQRAHIDAQLQARQATLGNGIRKAVTQRDMLDTRAGLDGYLESVGRMKDRDTAVNSADMAIDQLGGFAGYRPDQQQALKQKFRETAARNEAGDLVRNARDSMRDLDAVQARINSDAFTDLDPGKRGQLETQILARKQYLQNQADIAERRAEAVADRRLREAEHATNAMQKIVDNGGMPDAGMLAVVQAATEGTPYAAAVKQIVQESSDRAGFASRSPDQQRATILAERAYANTHGTNPALEAQIDRHEKIARESDKQLSDDPLVWGANRRIIDGVQPMQFGDIPGMLAQMPDRMRQASTISAYTNTAVSPLLKAEAQRLSDMLAVLPVQARAQSLQVIGTALSTQPGAAAALAAQIGEKDRGTMLALSYGSSTTTKARPVGELILKGQQALKEKGVKEDSAAETGLRATIAKEIGDAYANDQVRQAMIDASRFIAAGLKADGQGEDVRRAVRIATGGLYEQDDGSQVPKPYGWTDDQFEDRRRRVTPTEVGGAQVFVQGMPLSTEQFVKDLPKATLLHAGQGKYVVRAGSGFVTDDKGRRVVLDFNDAR